MRFVIVVTAVNTMEQIFIIQYKHLHGKAAMSRKWTLRQAHWNNTWPLFSMKFLIAAK